MYKIKFRAMGCRVEALSASESVKAKKLLRQVPAWFEEWEQTLSRFRLDSELSRLNRQSGRPFEASETLWDVLQVALQAEEESNGLVTPAILDALEYVGYERSFELLGTATFSAHPFQPGPSLEQILLDESSRTILLPEGLRLDFGGSAKGWAAYQAMQRLSDAGPALVNAGGDIAVSNDSRDNQSWEIGVLDPFHPDKDIANIQISSGGVATSGIDYRKWQQNGLARHHIIDPRTNLPAETDITSATIIAGNVMEAEMAAKTTLLLGSNNALEWLEANPHLAGLLILENGSMLQTREFVKYLRSENGREPVNKPIH